MHLSLDQVPPSHHSFSEKEMARGGTYFILRNKLWARQYTWVGYTRRESAHSRWSAPTVATALPLPVNAFRSRVPQYPVRRRPGYAPLPRDAAFFRHCCRSKRPARLRLRNHPIPDHTHIVWLLPLRESAPCSGAHNTAPPDSSLVPGPVIAMASYNAPATSMLEVVPI